MATNRILCVFLLGTLSLVGKNALAVDPLLSYPIEPESFTKVTITDDFWKSRLNSHYSVTLSHVLDQCEQTGRLNNLRIAAGEAEGEFQGSCFNDSDVYKILEGLAYSHGGPISDEHRKATDDLIKTLAEAQMDDGYLYSFYQVKRQMKDQWKNIGHMHELYCAGHLFEAGVAHFQATGKKDLLNVAVKFADLIDSTFGPDKRKDPPGHQEIELGLVKLYRVTGEKRYLNLAKFFLEQRGRHGNWYDQNHKPLLEQEEAVGHAVRAVYGYAGMADIAALAGDPKYVKALDRLWNSVVGKKMAISGGIGGGLWEAFDKEYFLPNRSSYNETCGSIAMVLWSHRMFLLHGDAKYVDVMERTLYNGVLTGVSLQGDAFFYPNPLESGGGLRHPWFGCACCPSNIARIIPSISGYQYAKQDQILYVNLFATSQMTTDLAGESVTVSQETQYPWDGKVKIKVAPEKTGRFTIAVRIPGWAKNQPVPTELYRHSDVSNEVPTTSINGASILCEVIRGYVHLDRVWEKDDVIELNLPMPVRRVVAHEKVKDDRGLVALERGPLVYCVEGIDNPDAEGRVQNLLIPDSTRFTAGYRSELLQGVSVITGDIKRVVRGADGVRVVEEPHRMVAVPYFARANRESTPMAIWLLRDPSRAVLPPVPSIASTSKASSSTMRGNYGALCDQIEPARSADASHGMFSWNGRQGTTEWVQYDFNETKTISSSAVYWYDRFGTAERRPESWRLLYKQGDQWVPVRNKGPYPVEIDDYSRVSFEPVRTNALRLEAKLHEAFLDPYLALPDTKPSKFTASVLEWIVQ